ncbi:MAG: hypothetical protein ACMUIE_06790 [Thermoplasmatota archaeon]
MKRPWPLFTALALLLIIPAAMVASATSASMSIENDVYYISVNPSDDNMGYLEIRGTVEGSVSNRRETVDVRITVALYEQQEGEPTGNIWLCGVQFDGSNLLPDQITDTDTTTLTYFDEEADFTVLVSPELYDPNQPEKYPVPPGIGPNITGELEITVTYSGDYSGEEVEKATIIPEYYHLVEVSTPTQPLEVTANKIINYTLRVINSGNDYESISVEVPLLQDLLSKGWTGSLSMEHKDYMEPGEEYRSWLLMKAPEVIENDETITLKIRAYSDIDPDTGEPYSEHEISIDLLLEKSGSSSSDDDDDDNDVSSGSDSPLVMVFVIAIVIVIVVFVLILFFKKGGGGDEDEGDERSSMVRI